MNANKEDSEDKQVKTTDCSGHVEPVVSRMEPLIQCLVDEDFMDSLAKGEHLEGEFIKYYKSC